MPWSVKFVTVISVALKFQARTLSSCIERILQSGHPSLFKLTNMQKSKSSNHFTWLFRHTKASFQKLTTKQRRWGWGRENEITLATLILVIIIEALLFFLFHPSAFPWEGQVSVSKKSRWSRVNLEPRSHSVGD